jgi:hypothetical protein
MEKPLISLRDRRVWQNLHGVSTMNTASSLSIDPLPMLRVPALNSVILRMLLPRESGWSTKTSQNGFIVGCHIIQYTDFVLRKPFRNDPDSKWN